MHSCGDDPSTTTTTSSSSSLISSSSSSSPLVSSEEPTRSKLRSSTRNLKFNPYGYKIGDPMRRGAEQSILLQNGYLHLTDSHWITSDEMTTLKRYTRSQPSHSMSPIFNNGNSKRRMTEFPKVCLLFAEVLRIHDKICDILRDFVHFDEVHASHLRSMAGACPQESHLDFDPTTEGMREAYRAQNGSGTHFAIFPIDPCVVYIAVRSHNAVHEFISTNTISDSTKATLEMTKISLLPGQILIVRGDVVHAGGEYEGSPEVSSSEDYIDRLHFYLDNHGISRHENKTWRNVDLMNALGSEFDAFQLWLKEKKKVGGGGEAQQSCTTKPAKKQRV